MKVSKITGLSFLMLFCFQLVAQNKSVITKESALMNVAFPSEVSMDSKIFSIAAAKTTLEMEATPHQITIGDVEVFSFKNVTGNRADATKWIEQVKTSILKSGYTLQQSATDPSFCWVTNSQKQFLLYTNAGKKEAALYVGVVSGTPFQNSSSPTQPSVAKSEPINQPANPSGTSNTSGYYPTELIGNWGTLAGAKVNWQDGSTGVMVVSGVSKGFGIEFKADGTFLQVSVVTSGRPSYRVYSSTTGTYKVEGSQITFFPKDRHYRKWENEIIMTDEHSVPEQYIMFWHKSLNTYTNKDCLYIRYVDETEDRELCAE